MSSGARRPGADIQVLKTVDYGDWDRLCLESDDAWFWHTTAYLDYALDLSPELRPESKSFFIADGSRILAICPLILERSVGDDESREIREFSIGGSFGWNAALANELSPSSRGRMLQRLSEHVDELAAEFGVHRAIVGCTPIGSRYLRPAYAPANPLIPLGYSDMSISTRIIDLKRGLDELQRDMRKGHRSDIRRGDRALTLRVFDAESITRGVIDEYQSLHRLAAGRVTRAQSTWDAMYRWIQDGQAALFAAQLQDGFVGFSLISTYKSAAYYGSSCNHPEHRDLPISHALQWEAICWLKAREFSHYEIGWQEYGPQPHIIPSSKEIDIARFKRGFGGSSRPFFRGEKYYSRSYYLSVAKSRMEAFAATLG